MEHPKDVGDRSTLAIMLGLRDAGFAVSVPFGENTRYDLIADDGERLLRVQCKSGRLRRGAIVFATASTYGHWSAADYEIAHVSVRPTGGPGASAGAG
jgi:hypothetical protein